MFSKEFINYLLKTVDIVCVINYIIPLKKTGTLYKGLCPFKLEKKPSLVVYQKTQSYHCHGCGKSGNVIAFLMSYYKINFSQAIIDLCEKYQIPVRRIGKKGTAFETERKKATRRKRQMRREK